ncbi:hypothetical protein CAI21_13835 [Alkalilimnicola ehrlichii]|uniref:HTH araC/xylS-type domain-containing protein n=1 Tax=Alkalilimnicola ehrlichii TaxID=351052 RepID=A0A3E0WNU7_9GAMM|nr:AraC family transcriptional regulator [Alkalilimnicola ehrlichii]RFA27993.1 hypothetical protein CAI21_13835 [Alkalilimnicola ehrlichii]RFA34644.1 hypothetical protein CAL65_14875 [Alkalilimnicola ehrlichii]
MTIRNLWFENDTRCIPAHYHAASLIDLALSREVEVNRLLSGTGLFYERLVREEVKLSPRQLYRLFANAECLIRGDDVAFLYGHRLFPGSCPPASTALLHGRCLYDALETLVANQMLLTPLLMPRLVIDTQWCYLHWVDSCGAGASRRFLVEAAMAGFTSLCRWLSGSEIPWAYQLDYSCPGYPEQYHVHLGEQVDFAQPVTAMRVPSRYLHTPWPNGSGTNRLLAQRRCDEESLALGFRAGIQATVYAYLMQRIRRVPTLERCSADFHMSPATLKRKLHKHGTSFQQLLDSARKHVSVYLIQGRGYSNEQVADYLGFHDCANFRRSFKRWTGLTPSAYRHV